LCGTPLFNFYRSGDSNDHVNQYKCRKQKDIPPGPQRIAGEEVEEQLGVEMKMTIIVATFVKLNESSSHYGKHI
jgi:hypothetical protein